ncbi:MAG TPA: sigma-70 family RNA polymerase sigma factor [Actinomycetota bacterium]|nr:sigma-70 family RNA polymerase sigma factor [Actinomycetota bacterium]
MARADAENELLRAVGCGDPDALGELYRAFERPLHSLGMRWLSDHKLAEELVQEVTFRIWRRAATFDESRGAASSWIFGIARNVASDLARERARRPIAMADLPRAQETWDEDKAWEAWQVSLELKRLPHQQQEIIELAYGRDMTQAEVANTLGIPLGTVKTRLYAGLKSLRRSLVERGVVEESSR